MKLTCDPAEGAAINAAAHVLMGHASAYGQSRDLDPITMAGALGLAMTRILATYVGNTPEEKLRAAQIMADTSMSSMREILGLPEPGE